MTGKLCFSLILFAWLSTTGAAQTRVAPNLVLQTGHGSPVNQLTFSSNGHLLGSPSSDGTTKAWDVAAGSIIWSFDQKGGGPGISPSEEFSPISISETLLLSGQELGYVDEISMQTGTVLTSVAHGHPEQILEQWLQGAEATLPSVAKQFYPAVKEDDVQLPLLLDFAKHNSKQGVVQQ